MFVIRRSGKNPLLTPIKEHSWEAYATFNWCPVKDDKKIFAVYRAVSEPQILRDARLYRSTIGIAQSLDGDNFTSRRQLLAPQNDWEKYGCEDPRITKFEGKFYIFYTALSEYPFAAPGIKSAVAITSDLNGAIEERHLVTPFNAKAMTLFPEKIQGKIVALLTIDPDRPPSKIALAHFDREEDLWSEKYWHDFYADLYSHTMVLQRNTTDHVEIGAPPVKTDQGWLLVYSHIQNYFTNSRVFGIEALLLDLSDPHKIIGRTKGPMFIPEEIYERYGHIGNIVFPTGVLLENNILHIYYGAADTTCCRASVRLDHLINTMLTDRRSKLITRFENNPIITPDKNHPWEEKATLNPAAIEIDGKIHLLYRAMSQDNTSTIGYATTTDGFHIDEKLSDPIYTPRADFEVKKSPGANSGCEDARIVQFADRLYMCYTAFNGKDPWGVAMSEISVADFCAKKWNWSAPVLITPEGVEDKDTCIFPEKINDKYMIIHRVDPYVCADFVDTLKNVKEHVTRYIQVFGPRPGMWDGKKVGIASPPLKTDQGWLLFYHGVSEHGVYRVGAVLLDPQDPTSVMSRTSAPIMEPETPYEKVGQVGNVVFPCGIINRNGTLFIYYGGGDSVVGGATMKLNDLLEILTG